MCGIKVQVLGLVFIFSLATTTVTWAAAVYIYDGNRFTDVVGSLYSTFDRVTATLTLDTPLAANTHFPNVIGLPGSSLTMSDGVQTLMTLDIGTAALARIDTDANGDIVEWLVRTTDLMPFGTDKVVSTGNISALPGVPLDRGFSFSNQFASVANNPGSWRCSGMCLTAVPVPSSFLLLGTGLAGFVGWRWWSGKRW